MHGVGVRWSWPPTGTANTPKLCCENRDQHTAKDSPFAYTFVPDSRYCSIYSFYFSAFFPAFYAAPHQTICDYVVKTSIVTWDGTRVNLTREEDPKDLEQSIVHFGLLGVTVCELYVSSEHGHGTVPVLNTNKRVLCARYIIFCFRANRDFWPIEETSFVAPHRH